MRARRLLILALFLGLVVPAIPAAPARATNRFYPQTGFSIDDPHFQDYFDHRGGVRTFGYPVSRKFTLLGFPVQIFQRAIMQLYPDGHVQLMNLLDDGLFPYTTVNGAMFPARDNALVNTAPLVGTRGYGSAILAWIANIAPNSWNRKPVSFYQSFASTVTAADVFPRGRAKQSSMVGFDLEIWGVPTSRPAFDPQNTQFVYQRFQRGILHYDAKTNVTQGILLADYFKGILMGENLPPDLAAHAKSSVFYAQYNPLKPDWVERPVDLPNTDLTRAFEPAPLVVLDPGHGGQEIGASFTFPDGTVLREKDLNLTVALATAAYLKQEGIPAILTRSTDSWVDSQMRDVDGDGTVKLADDLQMRIDTANNAHATLFLSIHQNGYADPSKQGTTVYYDDARPFSRRSEYFAQLLDEEAAAQLANAGYQALNRGVQTDSSAVGMGQHFYVLGPDAVRPSQMPGALAEGLFLTNPVDATHLRDPHILTALAQAYARAIQHYFYG
jgi:N-acetylmuramoyl-L-alanine amidase